MSTDSVLAARLADPGTRAGVLGDRLSAPQPQRRRPDDGVLVDAWATIAPDEAARHRLLVDNPAATFGW